MTAVDEGQPPQHLDALTRANETRMARARVMRVIRQLPKKEGLVVVADLLEREQYETAEVPWWLSTMKVAQLLHNIRRIGPHNVPLLLKAAGLGSQTVGELTDEQCSDLIVELRERAR